MNYEFHVGDYVETVSGAKGYIDQILSKEPYYFRWIVTDTDGAEFSDFCATRCSDLSKYARIGQYDFTKPEQPKEIKKLPDGYGDGYVLYKGTTEVSGTVENGWVSIGALSSKINELVDAVNELMKKNINE